MTIAYCFSCGEQKAAPIVPCGSCRKAPQTEADLVRSLILSNEFSTQGQLAHFVNEVRSNHRLTAPESLVALAREAARSPKYQPLLAVTQSPRAETLSASIVVSGTSTYTQGRVLPDAIGIETEGSSFTTILSKGSNLPCSSSQMFSTWEDDQDRIMLHICSGDSSDSTIIQGLGVYQILGIPPMPRGTPQIRVEFMADVSGITLKATDCIANSALTFKRVSLPAGQVEQQRTVSKPPPIPSKPVYRLTTTVLHQSAFMVLGVTARDNRKRIVDVAEERSLELDHDVCQKARSDLTNPRTRLSAEIGWLPGVSPRKASQLVSSLLTDPMVVREESGLPTLAHLNLLAAAFEAIDDKHDANDLAEFIIETACLTEELSPEDVLRDINEDRAVSGFPEVRAIDQVEAELAERKRYYRSAIKDALNRLPPMTLIQVMTETVDGATSGGDDHAPGLIDDLVDSYEVETQDVLQREAENVKKLIKMARENVVSGEAAVKTYVDKLDAVARNWDKIAQPIQLSSKARGIDHEPSHELAWAIRDLAIELFNQHDMLTQSQRLTSLTREIFAEVPEVSERVGEDAEALARIRQRRKEASAIDPIKKLVESTMKRIERSPNTAGADGERLLDEGRSLLKAATITPNSPAYREAQNLLAKGVMHCAIAFGNQTSNWTTCISLLQRALELASDTELRKRLNDNLTIVRENQESIGDLEPIKSTPSLYTVNGIGFTLYGSTDPKPDGSHMATYYFVFLAIPIFPISRYRVIQTGRSYRFLGKGPLRTFDYWHLAVSIGLILLMFALS